MYRSVVNRPPAKTLNRKIASPHASQMYLGNNDGSGSDFEGSWGTVCGEEFSLTAANVACRQMGFKYATGWNYTIYTPYVLCFTVWLV